MLSSRALSSRVKFPGEFTERHEADKQQAVLIFNEVKLAGFNEAKDFSYAESGDHRRLVCRNHSHLPATPMAIRDQDSLRSYRHGFFYLQGDLRLQLFHHGLPGNEPVKTDARPGS